MRHVLAAVLCLSVVPTPAWAGEKYLGKIVSAAGADTSNESGTSSVPFWIPRGAKLTIVCNAAAYICVDTSTACTATAGTNPGLPVTSGEKFPTSVGPPYLSTVTVGSGHTSTDGGTSLAAGSALVRIFGSGAVTCDVYTRDGAE